MIIIMYYTQFDCIWFDSVHCTSWLWRRQLECANFSGELQWWCAGLLEAVGVGWEVWGGWLEAGSVCGGIEEVQSASGWNTWKKWQLIHTDGSLWRFTLNLLGIYGSTGTALTSMRPIHKLKKVVSTYMYNFNECGIISFFSQRPEERLWGHCPPPP